MFLKKHQQDYQSRSNGSSSSSRQEELHGPRLSSRSSRNRRISGS
jgi:hypothetical protein